MSRKLDLLLLKPGDQKKIYGQLGLSLSAIEPPLWAALIAAYVRKQSYTVDIIDTEVDNLSLEETVKILNNFKPRLIGFIVTGSNLSA